eukprot:6184380-Pleurochrysis_carterae.AAC.1
MLRAGPLAFSRPQCLVRLRQCGLRLTLRYCLPPPRPTWPRHNGNHAIGCTPSRTTSCTWRTSGFSLLLAGVGTEKAAPVEEFFVREHHSGLFYRYPALRSILRPNDVETNAFFHVEFLLEI